MRRCASQKYSCPFCVLLGGIDVVGLYVDVILYSNSKAVVGHYPALYHSFYKNVGKGEIVGIGIVFIRVKVGKNVGNIYVSRFACLINRILDKYEQFFSILSALFNSFD